MRNEKIMLKGKKGGTKTCDTDVGPSTPMYFDHPTAPAPHLLSQPNQNRAVAIKWWMLQDGLNVIASNWSQLGEETIMRSVGKAGAFIDKNLYVQQALWTVAALRRAEMNNISQQARLHNTSTPVVALLPHCCTVIFPPFWLHVARLCHCSPVSFHYMTVEPLPLRCWRCLPPPRLRRQFTCRHPIKYHLAVRAGKNSRSLIWKPVCSVDTSGMIFVCCFLFRITNNRIKRGCCFS